MDIRAPRIELGTYCVLGNRHNQLDQARIIYLYGLRESNSGPTACEAVVITN